MNVALGKENRAMCFVVQRNKIGNNNLTQFSEENITESPRVLNALETDMTKLKSLAELVTVK